MKIISAELIPPKVYQLLVHQDPQELKAQKPPKPGKHPAGRPKTIIHQNHKNVKPLKKDRKEQKK